MIPLVSAYLPLALALIGLTFGLVQSVRIERKFRRYEPLVKRAMTLMGNLGNVSQEQTEIAGEVEEALKGGVFAALEQKYPELSLVLGWLEEKQPEIFAKIADNPQIAVALYKKYAPLITGIIGGKSREQRQMYDV